ncbi:hypothetical protein [Thermococcus sp.]|uniref:hypothetical protein n=1 Tax=Thermococcus sp. TaxID=35749 RepID=UPI00262A9444|nr:hypothetical protein [Thermococcus sp.]
MDFALFMERYGYKLLLITVVVGLFGFLFGGLLYSFLWAGYKMNEALFFIGLLVVASLVAVYAGRFMNRALTLLGRVRYHYRAKLLEDEKRIEREREKLREEGGKLY